MSTRSSNSPFRRLGRDVWLILGVALSVWVMLALASYDQNDPAWFFTGINNPPLNMMGPLGALISEFMLIGFGYMAFALPVLIVWHALSVLREKALMDLSQTRGWIQFFGWWLALAGFGGLFTMAFFPEAGDLPPEVTAGGALGQAMVDAAVLSMGFIGGGVALFALGLAGLTLAFSIQWTQVLEALGRGLERFWQGLLGRAQAKPQADMNLAPSRWQRLIHPLAGVWQRFQSRRALKAARASKAKGQSEATAWFENTHGDSAEPNLDGLDDLEWDPVDPDPIEIMPDEPPMFAKPVRDTSVSDQQAKPSEAAENQSITEVDDEPETPSVSDIEPATKISDLLRGKFTPKSSEPAERVEPNLDWEDETVRDDPPFDLDERVEPHPAEPHPAEPRPVEPASDKVPVTEFSAKDLGDNTAAPELGESPRKTDYKLPGLELMIRRDSDEQGYSVDELQAMGELLELRLGEFKVKAKVVEVHPGPVVTRFEIQPAPGVKASRISNLAQDLARSLAVARVRVVEVIPGKSVVGVEIPNAHRRIIRMREVIASDAFTLAESPLTLALGHDISGEAVVANVAKMPHLLVAGTTGSGKSVGINSMLVSMLYKAGPDEVRFILVDPKMLELSVYEGIPHLLSPVVTDMKEAANALRWCVGEMERRYKLMAQVGVRNLAGFNKKVKDARDAGEPMLDPLWNPENAGIGETSAPELDTLPMIVVVIDEFADMMMIVGKKVDQLIARIAQKARAAGIHLILATQRPSVDVITGLIKANVPTRIGFQVSSKIDSRTVLDQGGAEQLLGHGDMLFLPPGTGMPVRVHGCLVEDDEVHRVVEHWKGQGSPDLVPDILSGYDESEGAGSGGADGEGGNAEESDPLYDQAVEFVLESRRASISAVQRKLKIGYNRSARMIEAMEAAGVVSSMGHNGQREVIAPKPRSHD